MIWHSRFRSTFTSDMSYLSRTMRHCASKKQLILPWLPETCLHDLAVLINELRIDYDYLPYRTGREVIVDDAELLTSVYYYLLITDQLQAVLLKPFFDNLLQIRLTVQSIRQLKHQGYKDSTCPPISIAYDSLCKSLRCLNDKAVDVISVLSPQLGEQIKKEIFNLKINA